jgi:Putative lumazine-binding
VGDRQAGGHLDAGADRLPEPADRDAILAAAADYIEAWLDGDAERMARCLHPELAKRSPADGAGPTGEIETLSRDDMVTATATGLGTRYARPWEASVLDAYRDIATVRVRTSVYMDYLHLVRSGDRWLIVNVLWQRLADA